MTPRDGNLVVPGGALTWWSHADGNHRYSSHRGRHHDRGRAAAEIGRRRARHRWWRRGRISVEPGDGERPHPYHRDPGDDLLRHQPGPVDPGRLGPQAAVDHPKHWRAGATAGAGQRTNRPAGAGGRATRYAAPARATGGAAIRPAGTTVAMSERQFRGPGGPAPSL